MDKLVSVIIPVFNAERYLERCINSVIEQTFSNLEIIIINDGSSDNSYSICEHFAKKNSRINVIHTKNGGPSKARNEGLNKCSGDYVFFLDSDDYIQPNCISKLVSASEKSDADVTLAQNKTCPEKKHTKPLKEFFSQKREDILLYYFNGFIQPCPWNKLYKKEFIDTFSLRFKDKQMFEDQLWTFHWALSARSIYVIPESTYIYNIHNESISNSSSITSTTRINAWTTILQEMKLYCQDINTIKCDLFFLHKIEEALSTSIKSFSEFRYAYHKIKESLHEKPLHYWEITSKKMKKIFFFILQNIPSIIPEYLLYKHLKKRNK